MGLIERIKSVLGFGTSASPSQPTTGRDRPSHDDTGTSDPKPASEVESDEQLETAQTIVDPDDGVDVTVEHEPDEETETAEVEAEAEPEQEANAEAEAEPEPEPDAAAEPEPDDGDAADADTSDAADTDDGDTAAPATESEAAVKGAEPDAGTDADLEDIKGIGPTYGDRLRDAGVEGVADLATADAAGVAEASGIGESRIQKWIDRAETY